MNIWIMEFTTLSLMSRIWKLSRCRLKNNRKWLTTLKRMKIAMI